MPKGYGATHNQTSSPEAEKNWRENSRETWAKKRDFNDKNGCFVCTKKLKCEIYKKCVGVCPLKGE